MLVRPATVADFDAVLALNEASALHAVVEQAGSVIAFLLAFREGAAYASPNYRWFAERYPRFLYIDRVVVSEAARGRGAATRLYEHVFSQAAEGGVPWVTCEFDVDPPNPVSAAFHAKFGFAEVGRQTYGAAGKLVSLQAAAVR